MSAIFNALNSAETSAKSTQDQGEIGRVASVRMGVVVNNADPQGLRRIRATEASTGGAVTTDWLWRVVDAYDDPPLPKKNMLVEVISFEGNPHARAYRTMCNAQNRPLAKGDIVNDWYRIVPGDRDLDIGKNEHTRIAGEEFREIGGDRTVTIDADDLKQIGDSWKVEAGKDIEFVATGNIRIATKGGAAIVLTASGNAYIECAAGYRLTLGGSSSTTIGTDLGMNLAGGVFRFDNPQDVIIDSKSVTTIGAIDSRGDSLVTRGW